MINLSLSGVHQFDYILHFDSSIQIMQWEDDILETPFYLVKYTTGWNWKSLQHPVRTSMSTQTCLQNQTNIMYTLFLQIAEVEVIKKN